MIFAPRPSQEEFLAALAVAAGASGLAARHRLPDGRVPWPAGGRAAELWALSAATAVPRGAPRRGAHHETRRPIPPPRSRRYGRCLNGRRRPTSRARASARTATSRSTTPRCRLRATPPVLKVVHWPSQPAAAGPRRLLCHPRAGPQIRADATIPTLLSAPYFSCVVPGRLKAEAVRQALTGPGAARLPSQHPAQAPSARPASGPRFGGAHSARSFRRLARRAIRMIGGCYGRSIQVPPGRGSAVIETILKEEQGKINAAARSLPIRSPGQPHQCLWQRRSQLHRRGGDVLSRRRSGPCQPHLRDWRFAPAGRTAIDLDRADAGFHAGDPGDLRHSKPAR